MSHRIFKITIIEEWLGGKRVDEVSGDLINAFTVDEEKAGKNDVYSRAIAVLARRLDYGGGEPKDVGKDRVE